MPGLDDKCFYLLCLCATFLLISSQLSLPLCPQAELDITEKELEDLVISLDSDLTDEVDYRELAKGMLVWKRERREKKRELLSQNSGSSSNRSRSGSPGY